MISVGGAQTCPVGTRIDTEIWKKKAMVEDSDYLTSFDQGTNHKGLTLASVTLVAEAVGNACQFVLHKLYT